MKKVKSGTEVLLTTTEAAAYLGVAKSTLDTWRCLDRYGIKFVRVGRLIKYRQCELDAWILTRSSSIKRR